MPTTVLMVSRLTLDRRQTGDPSLGIAILAPFRATYLSPPWELCTDSLCQCDKLLPVWMFWRGQVVRTFEFVVEPFHSGCRIDTFLAKHLRTYTSWRLHRMVAADAATVNGLPVGPTQRVFRGQRVRVRLIEPPDKLLQSSFEALPIIYEDPWLVVIDKPAGIVCHPVGEFDSDTVTNRLQTHFDGGLSATGLQRPGIVHRLDRQTSGLLVVSRDQRTHRLLSDDIQAGRTGKKYLARVEGLVEFEEQQIDLPIGRHPDGNSVLMSAGLDAITPRKCRTIVRVLRRDPRESVVECELLTGRNHQIRVHMAAIGHPVLQDEFYGARGQLRLTKEERTVPAEQRHALHASQLRFVHPVLRSELCFNSVPPCDFWDLQV